MVSDIFCYRYLNGVFLLNCELLSCKCHVYNCMSQNCIVYIFWSNKNVVFCHFIFHKIKKLGTIYIKTLSINLMGFISQFY